MLMYIELQRKISKTCRTVARHPIICCPELIPIHRQYRNGKSTPLLNTDRDKNRQRATITENQKPGGLGNKPSLWFFLVITPCGVLNPIFLPETYRRCADDSIPESFCSFRHFSPNTTFEFDAFLMLIKRVVVEIERAFSGERSRHGSR